MNSASKIKIGTCAWSFEDWRGSFYPEDLASNRWLQFYARHFPAVEVDSTFYHTPSAQVVRNWCAQTPDDFSFVCKLPREITHDLKLRDAEEKLDSFLVEIAGLQPKLRCVLIQLPPSFSPDKDETALREFVSRLPRSFRFAIEFRHGGWNMPRFVHLLEEHGVCWVWNDTTPVSNQARAAFEFLPDTTDFLYLRLLGDLSTKYRDDGSRIHCYGGMMWPRDPALENWVLKIQKHVEEKSAVLIFANNHYEGCSPLTCQRIGERLRVELKLPDESDLEGEEAKHAQQLDLL